MGPDMEIDFAETYLLASQNGLDWEIDDAGLYILVGLVVLD